MSRPIGWWKHPSHNRKVEIANRAIAARHARAEKERFVRRILFAIIFGVALVLSCAMVFCAGCASPAENYVRAEADAWAEFDPYLDGWVDMDPRLSADKRDALHQVNVGRRARVAHALAEFGPVTSGSSSK